MKATSKAAHEFIKPHKQSHKDKIIAALEKIKVGATQDELAMLTGLRTDQCWRRMNELVKDGIVFDTGITRPLKSSCLGIVWQLCKLPVVNPENPTTEKQIKALKAASIPIKTSVIALQQNLF